MSLTPQAAGALFVREKAGDPTTSDITSARTGQLWRNTTTGAVKLWVNNNGTLVSVALA